jgi:hypothetical protein
MKLLVKPTGPHYYLDPVTGDEIQPFRASVIRPSQFINTLLGQAKLSLVAGDLTDAATDVEYEKFLSDSEGKEGLANDAFVSKFSTVQPAGKEEE